jgi:hypothetical protein
MLKAKQRIKEATLVGEVTSKYAISRIKAKDK